MEAETETAPEHEGAGTRWNESAVRLLESIPGVVTAAIEGSRQWVTEVKVWYEPTSPLSQLMAAVDDCLVREGARLAATKFQAIIAQPDRRATRRERPERALPTSVGSTPAEPAPADPTPAAPDSFVPAAVAPAPPASSAAPASAEASLKPVGYTIEEIKPGTIGVQVWIEWQGRTFSGAAIGSAIPPGSLRTPALATLRALHSCLQVLYQGPSQPGLVLDTAVRMVLEGAPVVIVTLTAAESARPRSLTAAWVDEDEPGVAVILATLHATTRTVTRWLTEKPAQDDRPAPPMKGFPPGSVPARKRFALVDFEVDHRATGDLDIGVRLSGFGEAVERRGSGRDDEAAQMQLGASVTLDAVHELLRLNGWSDRQGGDLRPAGTYRLRVGEQDVVVVRAEASANGSRVPLVGATSTDNGVERASITAALQATNPLVADAAVTPIPVPEAG